MGKLTHTVSGPVASFRSADKANIESLKCYFSPVQGGTPPATPSNIRPITGWTGLKIATAGKNMINPISGNAVALSGYDSYTISNGVVSVTGSTLMGFKVRCKPSEQYTFSFASSYTLGNVAIRVSAYSEEPTEIKTTDTFLVNTYTDARSATFTTQSTTAWIVCGFYGSNNNIGGHTFYNFQLESSSTATTYEAYAGQEISVNWATEAGTVYGGYVDLATGVLEKRDWASMVTLDGTQALGGAFTSDYIGAGARARCDLDSVEVLCDCLPVLTTPNPNVAPYLYAYISGGYLWYVIVPYKVSEFPAYQTTTDIANIVKQWIIDNNLTINVLYKTGRSATNATFQLTPTQIKTLLDTNNIWSNANGDTEVIYGIYDRLGKQRIALNTPHIVTTTPANTAWFSTDMRSKLESCKIEFPPTQLGSGDPSSTNIRQFVGWTGTSVGIAFSKKPILTNIANATQTGDGVITIDSDGRINYVGNGNATNFYCDIEPIEITTDLNMLFLDSYDRTLVANRCAVRLLDNNDTTLVTWVPNGEDSDFNDATATFTLQESISSSRIRITFTRSVENLSINPFFSRTSSYDRTDISWQTEAGTIYGGYVDVVKGELVEEWVKYSIGGQVWNRWGSQGLMYINHTNVPRQAGTTVYCDSATVDGTGDPQKKPKDVIGYYGTNASYPDYFFIQTEIDTSTTAGVNEAKQYISTTFADTYVLFKLKNPVHYSLSPETIKTLIGSNAIWNSENVNTTVKYWTH